jgi:lambda family phage tail tape measure protein
MTDAFVQFAVTGKLSFKDFAESVIRDLARIAY